jgi:hypothetical protein
MFEAGMSTVACFAEFALRILVRKSAIVSVICMPLTSFSVIYQLAFLTPGICPS